MAKKIITTETREIIPRYYGLAFQGQAGTRIFDNPSTAALAYVLITNPDKQGGLANMLRNWQTQKRRELRGEAGYQPLFTLTEKQANKLLNCSPERLVEIVRESIKRNHGSYNLWDSYGNEAVSAEDLELRGEVLTGKVKSQRQGSHRIHLTGAVRGSQSQLRYSDSGCGCEDSYWSETKGGQRITTRRNCRHVKAAELESHLQDTRLQSPSKLMMTEKEAHEGQRSLTFNFVEDPFLQSLIADILIQNEVLGKSAYEIDRILMTPPIGPAIMPLSLQEEVVSGRATVEIMKGKMKKGELHPDLLRAQITVDDAFTSHLRRSGFQWQGYCLELGQEAYRFQHPETKTAVSLAMTPAPFYVVRNIAQSRIPSTGIFTPDYGPQDPLAQTTGTQQRLDDRTRKITPTIIEPAVRLKTPETGTIYLGRDLPKSVIEAYRRQIRNKTSNPETRLKILRIKF